MTNRGKSYQVWLLGSAAALSMMTGGAAAAEDAQFNIAPQPLASALNEFSIQSQQSVLFTTDLAQSKASPGVTGEIEVADALSSLLAGTGLTWRRQGDTFLVQPAEGGSPQGASVAGGGADPYAVEALIVTAQKKEEAIQDVPIAISAFSARSLEEQKIEGGFDLLKAIPNVTFSKNNFTGYNFSIRGVGTKAISATTDPGVAVAFNNTTLIHNRLFEQEYLDVERVEVLRGPQGTLYGRNATAGVINVISAQPDLGFFEGSIKGEVGNYNTKRLSAMVNVPLIEDVLAVRLAGSFTARDGFDYNATTKNAINGRDLWTGRITVGFEPTERLRANLIWERFNEDDDRSRTGKQLCHRDDGPTHVGGVDLADGANLYGNVQIRRALFAQGCKAGSLYDDGAFNTPNGLSYSFILGPVALRQAGQGLGVDPTTFALQSVIQPVDPYGGLMQSRDLRTIDSIRDPRYRAKADLIQLNADFDITPELTFTSQTAFNTDETYSFQDYNRFKSLPVFTDTGGLLNGGTHEPSAYQNLIPGGIFCDPQIGCTDTIAGFDISQAKSEQFSQEFRLQSSFDGPFNFSAGVNYTQFETVVDYYVMFNVLTATAWGAGFYPPFDQLWDPDVCQGSNTLNGGNTGSALPVPASDPQAMCPYVDPNPVESINGDGHNYFRSKNPYRLKSTAAFGEAYWNIRDDLKLTAGIRYTDDRKTFIPVPSQTLLARSLIGGGNVSAGYPEDPPIKQQWGEFTGRLGLDWKPELNFTDETMLYAFYSHGYKGGGANPPSPDFATKEEFLANGIADGVSQSTLDFWDMFNQLPPLELTAVEYGPTFDPEFVDAFEIGAKNTLLDGALNLNLTGFYYDYRDYQVSQIRDRTAVNENFDAKTWGFEMEALFAPTRNLRINANLGYLDTEIADGETSIDIMDRTQSNPDYTLVKPWMQLPSNCVIPTHVAAEWARTRDGIEQFYGMCGGVRGLIGGFIGSFIADPAYGGARYDHTNYPELNGGAGLRDELGGNELPNAPHWTANLGAQYRWDVFGEWEATLRGDVYWQSQSWARVYNSNPYDKLHGWYNTNLSVWIEKPDDDLRIELYVKNVLNDTPLTDAFLNSDDTGLTTNVFVLDPRLIGLSIRKGF